MENVALTLLGIMIGTAATVLVSRYYFFRSVNKRLTPYIQIATSVLARIDPTVRDALKIQYRDVEIVDLYQLQFLVVNEGERAIRDCIEPLSLSLPKDVSVLDATILHVQPEELKVVIDSKVTSDGLTHVEFQFPLLNKGNYFLVKLLINGRLNIEGLKFSITADDLPPTIALQKPEFDAFSGGERFIDWGAVFVGAVFIVLSVAFTYGLFLLWKSNPVLFPIPWSSFNGSTITFIALLIWAIGILVLFGLGVYLILRGAFEDVFKRQPRFSLPPHIRSYPYW